MARKSLESKDFARLTFGVTLARHTAKKNLTELNDVFWFGERAQDYSRESYAAISARASTENSHGRFTNESRWKSAADQFHVWRRQHILISITSLVEIYLSSACATTLNAMPELIDRSLEGYDSVIFLKYPNIKPSVIPKQITELTRQITKGSWQERFSRLQRTFGRLPKNARSQVSKLQSLQDIRNSIAHSLGETGDIRRVPWKPRTAIEVSLSEVVDAFGVSQKLIAVLDREVFAPKIGLFDLFQEYHLWISKQENPNALMVGGSILSDFRDHIGRAFGSPPNAELTEKLIYHYQHLDSLDAI